MNSKLRDEMLRLMGGCVHQPGPVVEVSFWCEGWGWDTRKVSTCAKCGEKYPLPAVGDGHEPTMEELLALCRQRELGFVVVRWYGNECWVDVGYEPFSHECKGRGVEDAPRIALANAIAEAVKEVPA